MSFLGPKLTVKRWIICPAASLQEKKWALLDSQLINIKNAAGLFATVCMEFFLIFMYFFSWFNLFVNRNATSSISLRRSVLTVENLKCVTFENRFFLFYAPRIFLYVQYFGESFYFGILKIYLPQLLSLRNLVQF